MGATMARRRMKDMKKKKEAKAKASEEVVEAPKPESKKKGK